MIITGLLWNLLIAGSTLAVLWIIFLIFQNPSIVDLGWAIGLTLIGLFHNLANLPLSPTNIVIGSAILLWGLRLGGYIFWTRLRLGKQDPRYNSMQQKSRLPRPLFFLFHYAIQACFQTVIGIVFIFTKQNSEISNFWAVIGLIIWLTGFFGVIIADTQLHKFRQNKNNRHKVCEKGLWKYSRHPNYFFEILTWAGFAFFAISSPSGWIALSSPLALYLTMKFITGPISEKQSLISKPEAYAKYQQKTPMIFPYLQTQ